MHKFDLIDLDKSKYPLFTCSHGFTFNIKNVTEVSPIYETKEDDSYCLYYIEVQVKARTYTLYLSQIENFETIKYWEVERIEKLQTKYQKIAISKRDKFIEKWTEYLSNT